jgi:hypothetical protein
LGFESIITDWLTNSYRLANERYVLNSKITTGVIAPVIDANLLLPHYWLNETSGLSPEFRLVEVHAGLVEAEGSYDSPGPSDRHFGPRVRAGL